MYTAMDAMDWVGLKSALLCWPFVHSVAKAWRALWYLKNVKIHSSDVYTAMSMHTHTHTMSAMQVPSKTQIKEQIIDANRFCPHDKAD